MPITRKDVERLRERERRESIVMSVEKNGTSAKLGRGQQFRVIKKSGSKITVVPVSTE